MTADWATGVPAAVLAGVGAVLWLRPATSPSRGPALAATAAVLVWVVIRLGPEPTHVVGLAVASAALGGALLLLRRRRERLAARQRAGRLLEACGVLSSELTAGQPPGAALRRAALVWPGLEPVVRSHDLGADVPAAWRSVSRQAGAHDALLVAAAWQVSHRSGVGLGAALGRVAAGLRASGATRRVVESELASARATARLLAALPVLALVVGGGAVPGSSPWEFLLGTPVGLACLLAGLGLGFAGLWWIESIADDVERRC